MRVLCGIILRIFLRYHHHHHQQKRNAKIVLSFLKSQSISFLTLSLPAAAAVHKVPLEYWLLLLLLQFVVEDTARATTTTTRRPESSPSTFDKETAAYLNLPVH